MAGASNYSKADGGTFMETGKTDTPGRFESCKFQYGGHHYFIKRRLQMGNELKDITSRLCGYDGTGWQVTKAEQLSNGRWELTVVQMEKKEEKEEKPSEAADD